MLAIGIVVSVFGLGVFCWLLFTLAIYALPFLAGLTAGLAAFRRFSPALAPTPAYAPVFALYLRIWFVPALVTYMLLDARGTKASA